MVITICDLSLSLQSSCFTLMIAINIMDARHYILEKYLITEDVSSYNSDNTNILQNTIWYMTSVMYNFK